MRRAARVDSTQAAIVKALRRVGAEVLDLSRVGQGCPDLLVCFRGDLFLLEVKSSRGRLTTAQRELAGKLPVFIARTVDESLQAIGVRVVKAGKR